eukprot:jgi/Picsp_1/4926/NSC_02290-R1_---NA---
MENLPEGHNPREHDDQDVVSDSDVEPTDDMEVSSRLCHQSSRNHISKVFNGSIVTEIPGSVSSGTVPSDEDTFTTRPIGESKSSVAHLKDDDTTKGSMLLESEGDCPLMNALGDVLVNVLKRVSFADRLRVACVSRQLKDFVYEHHELWENINVVAEKEQPMRRYSSSTDLCGSAHKKRAMTKQGYKGALSWAASRREVRRLRVVVKDDDADMRMMTSRKSQKNLMQLLEDPKSDTAVAQEDSPMRLLVSTTAKLPNLISLSVSAPAYSNDCEFELLSRMIPTLGSSLKQLVLSSGDGLCVPNSLASLGGLQSLCLQSCTGGGVRIEDLALPASLKHLKIGGLAEDCLPQALKCVASLESLDINWAVDQDEEGAPTPDLSLLKASEHWCSNLKSLRLGYFEATRLPEWLPTSLIELELQWNLRTCAFENSRKEDVDVDDFLQSFDVMLPLKNLKHLNLNNAVGQWGLPSAVCKLHQLESLGVVTGSGEEGAHGSAHPSNRAQREHPPIPRGALAKQVASSFPNLKSLDIEIFEAASEAGSLAQLKHLQHLRLGKGESPETYVRPDVRVVVGRGLIKLLPSLPELEQVQTEGMLLPATASCGRWNRLLGFEAEELRSQAAAAVETLYRRGVALSRWYAWPFGTGNFESSGSGIRPWDEVV